MTLHHSIPILEVRSTPQGIVEGMASCFGGIDCYGDTVAPGAFADSLAAHTARGTVPAMLWSHATDRPVGRWEHLAEDSRGLFVRGRVNLRTAAGADAFEHLRAGDLNGLSIGYRVPRGGEEMRAGVRVLKAIDLHEISLVTLPADGAARVTAVKVAGERPATVREFEAALRGLGFSRREAGQIAAKGFSAIAERPGEPSSDELRAVKAALLSLATTFKKG